MIILSVLFRNCVFLWTSCCCEYFLSESCACYLHDYLTRLCSHGTYGRLRTSLNSWPHFQIVSLHSLEKLGEADLTKSRTPMPRSSDRYVGVWSLHWLFTFKLLQGACVINEMQSDVSFAASPSRDMVLPLSAIWNDQASNFQVPDNGVDASVWKVRARYLKKSSIMTF